MVDVNREGFDSPGLESLITSMAHAMTHKLIHNTIGVLDTHREEADALFPDETICNASLGRYLAGIAMEFIKSDTGFEDQIEHSKEVSTLVSRVTAFLLTQQIAPVIRSISAFVRFEAEELGYKPSDAEMSAHHVHFEAMMVGVLKGLITMLANVAVSLIQIRGHSLNLSKDDALLDRIENEAAELMFKIVKETLLERGLEPND